MAATVLTDAILWANDYNLTSVTHQIALNASVKEQDVTAFGGNGYVAMIGGLRQVTAEVHGYWDAPPDLSIYNSIGTFDLPVTIAPTSTEGSTAYMFQSARTKYDMFGKVGDAIPFNYSATGSNTVGLVSLGHRSRSGPALPTSSFTRRCIASRPGRRSPSKSNRHQLPAAPTLLGRRSPLLQRPVATG
jgi:hypothetical protein